MDKYEDFKKAINKLALELKSEGKEIIPKKWARMSPYQQRRYKKEHVFPEVWLYKKGNAMGIVVTADELDEWEKMDGGIKQYIINCLF
jgi:hypothetical protein